MYIIRNGELRNGLNGKLTRDYVHTYSSFGMERREDIEKGVGGFTFRVLN